MNRNEILERVRQLLVDVLSVDASTVQPTSRIMGDLGAESIDLLDLRFRIERAFGFSISEEELARVVGERITPEEFLERFTVEALCEDIAARLGSSP